MTTGVTSLPHPIPGRKGRWLCRSLSNAAAESPLPVTCPQRTRRIPSLIVSAGDRALLSFVNYFTAEIENDNTRGRVSYRLA